MYDHWKASNDTSKSSSSSLSISRQFNFSVDVKAGVTIESVEDADLVILGIRAPAADDDEDHEEEDKSKEEEEDEVIEPVLAGLAKELDEGVLAGSLTKAMMDHYKTFQNGAKAGTALPTLNIIVPGQKVSHRDESRQTYIFAINYS